MEFIARIAEDMHEVAMLAFRTFLLMKQTCQKKTIKEYNKNFFNERSVVLNNYLYILEF